MDARKLHDRAVIFDGLIVSKWSRAVFEDMRNGGLTAANCTCCVWENFRDTMVNIAHWNRWFRDHGDLIVKARRVGDITQAKADGKTAIVLGFQNTSACEDDTGFIEIFKDAGVGIMQITYNTQNLAGSGCYETTDSGLSDFGREMIAEMNRVGVLCDLSHVGSKTSNDVIRASTRPVAYSHCLPSGLKEHARNKSDDELRFIAERGGFIGVTMFPAFLKKGTDATVDDYVEAMDYIINIAGEDAVGFGTDFTQGYDAEFFHWITHDKGTGRKLVEFGEIKNPEGIQTMGEYPNLTDAMVRAGWGEPRITKVLGQNWLRLLGDVWGE